MKRVLVLGGAGFIGSHFCDFLLDKGHSVVAMDNLITGDLNNIKHLIAEDKPFSFVEHDITEHIEIEGDVDYILNLASPASPVDYLEHPIATLKVGSMGTHNSLGLARKKGAVVLLASTSEIYGDPIVHPQREDYWGNVNSIGPRSVYDEAKRYAEAITMAYNRYHGVKTRIVRIFNTYGTNMRLKDGRAIPNFMCQAINGEDITVYGDGSQTRSLCYVSDLVEGIYRLLISDEIMPVNIGNPNEITILELAERVIKETGSKSKIIYKDLPVDDPKQRCPDITMAKNILNWEPKIGLEEGLKSTTKYFMEKLGKN
ncbi:MAG: UDP-glucuronic acid decarboxylase family protein [Nitrospinota bacterium]|nr:SDR family oxidoreductase [Nitrospinota bacterium]